MSHLRFSTVMLFAVVQTIQANAAPVEFQSVLRRLPSDANVLLLFNVEAATVRKADAPNVQSYNVASRGGMAMNSWGGMYGAYQERDRYAPWRSLLLRGQQQARISTEERVKGGLQANAIMESVEEATAEMRRQLTERYKVEF